MRPLIDPRLLPGALAALALSSSVSLPARAQATASPPQAAGLPAVPGGPPVAARFVIKVEKGFIDDPVDIAAGANLVAVLLTDAASFARIDLIELSSGKPRRTIDIGDPQRLFERVVVGADGESVVLISRDAGNGRRSAQLYDAKGRAAGILGPADEFAIVPQEGEGKRVLVVLSQNKTGNATSYKVARHQVENLARLGNPASYIIDGGADLRRPTLKMVGWQRGFTELSGMRPGTYDKAKDVRLPGRAAVIDSGSGRFVFEADIGDVMAWAAASELRRKFPGRGLFSVFSPDAQLFELIDFQGRRAPIALPVPLRYYDPTSLLEQEQYGPATGTPGSLIFSLVIDPLHPEALARRKKDPSYLDLYRARPDAPSPGGATGKTPIVARFERLLRAPMDDRPPAWVASGTHAAVLRKHKNFSRGGNLLEIYPLEASID
jgi:hypothetical protein